MYVYIIACYVGMIASTWPAVKEGGWWIALLTLVVCLVLWWLMVAHKRSIKIHSCGHVWELNRCPNCGDLCRYCGKKAGE